MIYIMGTGSRSLVTDLDRDKTIEDLNKYIGVLKEFYTDKITLISGMAEGWDEEIARAAISNDIPFIAVVPNYGYGAYYWGNSGRYKEFTKLLSEASDIIYVCKDIYENGVHSNFIRNQKMVDMCNVALVYKPESRGTQDAVSRLIKAKKNYRVSPFCKL